MGMGLHKPGQGYWVRVMTATIIGLFTVALSAWAWKETALVTDRLPKTRYAMKVERFVNAAGQTDERAVLSAGQSVALRGPADQAGVMPKIGEAEVVAYDPDERKATIGRVRLDGASDPTATQQLVVGDPAAPTLTAQVQPSSVGGLAPVDPVLIKGGVVAVIILLGAFTAWYLAGARVRTVEFLIATDFEMKKVNWSTPREIVGSTWVVVITCLILALILYMFDIIMQTFFTLIRVIHTT